MALRVCSEPNCPVLVDKGRCAAHRRDRERRRGSRQARGYDRAHDALRAQYQRDMDRGKRFDCWRCDNPIDPQSWHLGHDDFDRAVYRGPECVPCNTATSGRH